MRSTVEMGEIRVFLALADELHFGHTADRLGLTQSRVSQSRAALAWRRRDSDPRLRAFIAIARQHLRRGKARQTALG